MKLKFRARTNDDDTLDGWVYSDTHGLSDFFHGIEEGRYNASTLCQLTDFKSRNRKEIYIGDILRNKYGDNLVVTGSAYNLMGLSTWAGDCDLIGNIYQNPELLKTT